VSANLKLAAGFKTRLSMGLRAVHRNDLVEQNAAAGSLNFCGRSAGSYLDPFRHSRSEKAAPSFNA
jgi:hypothetical protein